uniref:phosphatidylinositol-3,4,5-trisphosphate 3-phosphatase n=1 Tax=Kalanchoe fedtschenkoi TaxID=63787 RepID=A0A7N0ZSY2_KALFE
MGLKASKSEPRTEANILLADAHQHFLRYLVKSSLLRQLVSKKRRRMLVGGYDLDMSYITNRILAMSFPAEHVRAMYRNPLWQVKSVLDMRHPGRYKVYNLCIEQMYDPSNFDGRVETYPFDDNHVPPLHMMKLFCESVESWLSSDPNNIAVIHCMAGKGRTGLMVCAYLVYSGMSAEKALQLYAQRRTTNNEGVTIPSQRRYVSYWENVLSFSRRVDNGGLRNVKLPCPCSRELLRVRLYDTVNIESVFFVVSELHKTPDQLYCQPVEVTKNCCRQIRKGYHRNCSPKYYLSFIDTDDEEGKMSEIEEPRLVVQMDTERSALYKKTCLDYYFEKPIKVSTV